MFLARRHPGAELSADAADRGGFSPPLGRGRREDSNWHPAACRPARTFDDAVFATLDDSHISVGRVLRHVLTDRRSAQAYLRWLIANDNVADAIKVWEWSVSRGYADDKLAIEYVEFLMRKEMPEAAAKGWGRYAAGRRRDIQDVEPDLQRRFRGGSERKPVRLED